MLILDFDDLDDSYFDPDEIIIRSHNTGTTKVKLSATMHPDNNSLNF